ncbi:MAG: zf-TFIIB domain-containing protein [Labilithrix sp.]|nr:zf-TFIIB domain-containing protein [Labilithrix sp.]
MASAGIISNCFFCGSPGPAGGSCATCLVAIPRPSPEPAITFSCPRCAQPLLAVGIAPGATIHACSACQGVYFGARAWCTLIARPELSKHVAAKLTGAAAPPSQLIKMLECPSCRRQMERGRFGASSNIVIDVCVSHGMWLDAGEIVQVVEHAAYRSRVGMDAARRAMDAADLARQGFDPARAAQEVEAARRTAAAAQRITTAKRTGLVIFVVLVALRAAFYFRQGSAAPPEIGAAGKSAESAATAIGR